jgi:signal transduction histidine kinase
MKSFWKLFAALGTGSGEHEFARARFILTGWYLLCLSVIIVVFSVVLFWVFSHEIRENIERTFTEAEHQEADEIVIVDTVSQLLRLILAVDGCIVIVAGGLSYLLAGKTLLPIRKAFEAQTRFSADASHELRTPLAIMLTDCGVILRNADARVEQYRRVVKSNLEEVGKMSKLVEDLLLLSRGKAGIDRFAPVDLLGLARRTGERMQGIAAQKRVRLAVAGEGSAQVRGESLLLERVVVNLIQNALTYTSAGGSVAVRMQDGHRTVALTVEDSGSGIEEKDLPHVVKRFYKADQARARSSGGAGLGLSIVSEIIAMHHGTLDIASAPGKGTTVTVVLPKVS